MRKKSRQAQNLANDKQDQRVALAHDRLQVYGEEGESGWKSTPKVKVMSTRCHVMSCLNYIYIFGPV